MAIEIITRGIPPCETQYKCRCRSCMSVLKFVQSDGKITHDQRDGSFITIKCPVCGDKVHTEL